MGEAGAHRQGAVADLGNAAADAERPDGGAVLVDAGASPGAAARCLTEGVMAHLDGATERIRSVEQRAQAADDDQPFCAGDGNQRRVGAMIPPERDRHAIEQHRGLARVGAAHGDLHLAARVLSHEHERRLLERLLEHRRRRRADFRGAHDDGGGPTHDRRGARGADVDRLQSLARPVDRRCIALGLRADGGGQGEQRHGAECRAGRKRARHYRYSTVCTPLSFAVPAFAAAGSRR